MATQTSPSSPLATALANAPRRLPALIFLTALWLLLFAASLFTPPLLDDADATHANAARHIALTGDLVTLHVNGIRYLEKAPLPYWLVAASFRLFGFNAFAAHLPQAIAILLLALLGYRWAAQVFDARTAFYTGLALLTSAGVFLFTRVFIPEALFSLFLCAALYSFLRATSHNTRETPASLSPATHAHLMWTFLALAVLTKGLVAIIFLSGTALIYLALTGQLKNWRSLKPLTGTLLFLAIAAPWHILAGLRNTEGMDHHGFFWFYFINEHFLRFLGRRYPRDYNKLPTYLYWTLHLVWLFPWSIFFPLALLKGWQSWKSRRIFNATPQSRTVLLLAIYSALVLFFFSLSTNQEYYTFPAYLPLLLIIAASLTRTESNCACTEDHSSRRWLLLAHAALTAIGVALALTLAIGLWTSRHIPFVPDIGDLLAHRNVGHYTLSMSHLFDLTGPSFAALRRPAAIAAIAFLFGPAIAWFLRVKRRHLASTITIALTSAVFLLAAHIAFARFSPMLSSYTFAARIQSLEDRNLIPRNTPVLLYGDQSFGSSIGFYLGRTVSLVDGRSSSMLFGSTFPDAPPIFLTPRDLLDTWATGPRKLLFVPLEHREDVNQLLAGRPLILLQETSGKALYTDRPLDQQQSQQK